MTDVTIAEAFEKYRTTVSILKKGFAQESFRVQQIQRSFLGEKLVRESTSVDIARYRDERLSTINPKTGKPISPATVRLEMSLLSNFYEICKIEWGYADQNPVEKVRKPKAPPGRDRRLTAREEKQILRYCHNHSNPELYSIFVLAIETAMRQSEILRLSWEHINLKTRIAHLPDTKNGTKRDVPLSLRAREALIRLGVKPKGPCFFYSLDGFKSTWRFMTIKLGIKDLHFHDCRHEATSRLFERGVFDVMEVAAITGHKSLAMLKRYTHLRAERLARKMEGNKHRGRRVIVDHLIPYPASITPHSGGFRAQLLDFDNVYAYGRDYEETVRHAQDALLRQILTMMRHSQSIPPPDQYLDPVDEQTVIMIDPLTYDDAFVPTGALDRTADAPLSLAYA